MVYNWDLDRLKNAVASSCSYQAVLRTLSIPTRGNNVETLKRYINKYNIDISHFTFTKPSIGPKYPIEDYLTNKRFISCAKLRERLLKENIKEHKCERCSNTHWEGNIIPLELHHINGDHTDNRLENLQLLCPNCHALTDTYCRSKKKNEPHLCKKCHRPLKTKKANLCPQCAAEERHGRAIPIEKLLYYIQEGKSNVEIGKIFEVSEAAIRKRRKKLNV